MDSLPDDIEVNVCIESSHFASCCHYPSPFLSVP